MLMFLVTEVYDSVLLYHGVFLINVDQATVKNVQIKGSELSEQAIVTILLAYCLAYCTSEAV